MTVCEAFISQMKPSPTAKLDQPQSVGSHSMMRTQPQSVGSNSMMRRVSCRKTKKWVYCDKLESKSSNTVMFMSRSLMARLAAASAQKRIASQSPTASTVLRCDPQTCDSDARGTSLGVSVTHRTPLFVQPDRRKGETTISHTSPKQSWTLKADQSEAETGRMLESSR